MGVIPRDAGLCREVMVVSRYEAKELSREKVVPHCV